MLTLPGAVRILLATQPVDMRNSIDGLMGLVRTGWGEDVYSGHLFVFVSRKGDRVKILTFSRGGFVLYYKRLEMGRFRLPRVDAEARAVQLDATQLAMLLDGIDVQRVERLDSWPPAFLASHPGNTTTPVGCWRGYGSLPSQQHPFCPWREEAEELHQRQVVLEAKVAALEKRVFGKKSERMPTVQQMLRRQQAGADTETRRQQALEKQRQRAARRAEAPTREVHHPVPEAERICPACGGDDLKPLGQGRTTVVYEYIPARFEKQVHVQQTLACACGKGVVMAPAPPKVVDRGEYGPGFIANVVASKCADSMPLHRLAQRLERGGVPMSRSTLTDLFHLAAEVLSPVSVRLLQHIARNGGFIVRYLFVVLSTSGRHGSRA